MRLVSALALVSLPAHGAAAQATSTPAAAATVVGVWRGTSACKVHPSACKDEIVVMCRFVPKTGELDCAVPQGVWQFRARHDTLVGELRLPDDTRFREVRAMRTP